MPLSSTWFSVSMRERVRISEWLVFNPTFYWETFQYHGRNQNAQVLYLAAGSIFFFQFFLVCFSFFFFFFFCFFLFCFFCLSKFAKYAATVCLCNIDQSFFHPGTFLFPVNSQDLGPRTVLSVAHVHLLSILQIVSQFQVLNFSNYGIYRVLLFCLFIISTQERSLLWASVVQW